jgi:SAM-dependent methyltransferase
LLRYAASQRPSSGRLRILDIGGGAGRNAVPLSADGALLVLLDLSWPMLRAAATREGGDRLRLALASMAPLPIRDRSVDLIVAHGIWNLARSDEEFRLAVREAARVARPGAGLFLFTFSRNTLAPDARPVEGESFTFTQFSGGPQIFVRDDQLVAELHAAGFDPDPALPLRELNLPPPGQRRLGGPPVIYEGAFRRRQQGAD